MDVGSPKKVAAFALLAAGGLATPPGAGYQWQQPGRAPVGTPSAQPVATAQISMPPPGSGYAWAQPGCAHAASPDTQP